MATLPTAADARDSLTTHAASKGVEVFLKYGPGLDWDRLQALLADRTCVRYPCRVEFRSDGLRPGEFAHAEPCGERPEEGFVIWVHPFFRTSPDDVPWLVLYHLVTVNYGPFASADDAEMFGAAALGLVRDNYYDRLCVLADALAAAEGAGGCRARP